MDHADRLGEVDGDAEIAAGRTDLRHLPLVTSTAPDAKDFDDAVCLMEENGQRTLWVAIADVAHYVQAGTALDRSAAARATSVYCLTPCFRCCHQNSLTTFARFGPMLTDWPWSSAWTLTTGTMS